MRKSNLKALEPETDPEENDDENGIEETPERIKETKFNNLLAFLKDFPDDFEIWLYKRGDRQKRYLVAKFDNYIPDPFLDIQAKFGGGEYRFMLRSNNQMIDSADFNLLDTSPGPGSSTAAPSSNPSRTDLINELKVMADLFKSETKPDSNLMLELTKMQLEQARIMAESQQKSEQRITGLIMEMQSKKPALSEIMDVIEFVDSIKGNSAAAPENIIEKIISHPLAAPFVQKLLENTESQKAIPQPENSQKLSAPGSAKPEISKPEPRKLTAADFFSALPEDFKKSVTVENKESVINNLYEHNKDKLSLDSAREIIDLILSQRN